MKHVKSIVTRVAALTVASILLLTLLCSCSKGNKFEAEGAVYKDKKTDVSYVAAPSCYEPMAIGKEIYGHSKTANFYEIEGQDPLSWICEEGGTVFHADSIELPTPEEMEISYINICVESTSILTKSKVQNAEDISDIISGYVTADNIYYRGTTPELTYKIRFADSSIGVFYSVVFVRYSEDYIVKGENETEINYGKDFLYNRFEDRFVKAPEALVKYVNELS